MYIRYRHRRPLTLSEPYGKISCEFLPPMLGKETFNQKNLLIFHLFSSDGPLVNIKFNQIKELNLVPPVFNTRQTSIYLFYSLGSATQMSEVISKFLVLVIWPQLQINLRLLHFFSAMFKQLHSRIPDFKKSNNQSCRALPR